MTSKQLVNQLYTKMTSNLNFTDEQIKLITKLHQSFETDEERSLRIQKFHEVVAKTQQS
jgi:hypothetical protein